MLVGMVILANTGIIPHNAPLYDAVGTVGVPVAVFLLLLRANLRQVFTETGRLLRLYIAGALASAVGIIAAFYIVPVTAGAQIAGVQSANLIGGTVNVMAVAQAVGLSGQAFTVMIAGAAPIIPGYLLLSSLVHASPFMRRLLPAARQVAASDLTGADAQAGRAPKRVPASVSSLGLAALLALAVTTLAVSDVAMRALGQPQLVIIAVTAVALIIANTCPGWVARASGDRELGSLIMFVFFGTLGASVDVTHFGFQAVMIFLFVLVAVAIHFALLFGFAVMTRSSLAEFLVASVAGIGGPTTAAAIAISFEEESLVTPGILCGLLGFAIATFAGIGLTHLLG